MLLSELIDWTRREMGRLAARRPVEIPDDLVLYVRAAKLVEEVGELHAELLGRSRLQRADKLPAFTPETLAGEVADVLICTLILAETVGVDVEQALARKMAVIDARETLEEEKIQ